MVFSSVFCVVSVCLHCSFASHGMLLFSFSFFVFFCLYNYHLIFVFSFQFHFLTFFFFASHLHLLMLVLSSIGLVLLSPSFFRLRRVVVLSPLHLQGGVAVAASSFSVVVLSRYLLSGGGVLLPSHILPLLPPHLFFSHVV